MKLRVYRTYTWEFSEPSSMRRIGGGVKENPRHLVPHDKLQYMAEDGKWTDVEIFKEEIPEHPVKREERIENEMFLKDLK